MSDIEESLPLAPRTPPRPHTYTPTDGILNYDDAPIWSNENSRTSDDNSRTPDHTPRAFDENTRISDENTASGDDIEANRQDSAIGSTESIDNPGNSGSSTGIFRVPTDNARVAVDNARVTTTNARGTDNTRVATENCNTRSPIHTRSSTRDDHKSDEDKSDEPPAKIRKIDSSNEELDGETCPICLDSWNNTGDHRLVALKCGHLFGAECVRRWLKAQTVAERTCPTCKCKANLRDLRFIYARRLVATDTSQITSLQKQIECLQAQKNRVDLELQKSKIAHRACSMQLEVLRSLMRPQVNKEQPQRRSWRFALEKNLEISRDGGCRVLTYNCRTYELYVSQKSANSLFPGYGIRKVNCLDYSLGQFVHLHPKPIRDITYSQPRDLLLSVGLDSTARIVERGIPSLSTNAGMQLWSCSWDYLRSNEFYVGGVGGIIHQYDVRNLSNHMQMLSTPGDISPVVSLCSTEFGLLSCQLNSSWLWVGSNRQWEPRSLPVEGSFMSLCYDNESHRAVISCWPSANRLHRSKLTLCKLKASVSNGEVLFDVEDTFNGSYTSSYTLSRAAWVKAPDAAWIAAYSKSDATLFLHGIDGARTMSLPAATPAIDTNCIDLNGNTILAALSESRLRIFKAVSTNS